MLLTVKARCSVGVVAFTVALTGCGGKDSPSAPTNTPPPTPNCYRPLDWRQRRQIAYSSNTSANGDGHLIERHHPGGHEPDLVVDQRHRGICQ